MPWSSSLTSIHLLPPPFTSPPSLLLPLGRDIAVGNVLPPGGGASVARMAALSAGIPNTTPINTVNRQCSSGLTAVAQIANEIKSGEIDIGIGECPSEFTRSSTPLIEIECFLDIIEMMEDVQ